MSCNRYTLLKIIFLIKLISKDFEEITNWWKENHYNRHLYIGHGIYKLDKNSPVKEWRSVKQVLKQVEMVRESDDIKGSMYFSSKIFQANPKRINKAIRKQINKYPALIPEMPWIDSIPPPAPVNLEAEEYHDGIILNWQLKREKFPHNKPKYFVVYKFRGPKVTELHNSNIYSIQTENKVYILQRFNFLNFLYKDFTFVVTSVDAQNNESKPSKPVTIRLKPEFFSNN